MLFNLKIDGQAVDARGLECHHQNKPFPGGHHYELIITEGETLSYAKKNFGFGNVQLSEDQSRCLLSFLGGILQIRIGKENLPQFWANTIDGIEILDEKLVLLGICSAHVAK